MFNSTQIWDDCPKFRKLAQIWSGLDGVKNRCQNGNCVLNGTKVIYETNERERFLSRMNKNLKRFSYKMARVLEVSEVFDGRIISATDLTQDGKLKRPVVKLVPLFNESVFQEKHRVGDVSASQLQDMNFNID